MTTPLNTWISVKDAMPPLEIPRGFDLIVMDEIGCIFKIEVIGGWVNKNTFIPTKHVNSVPNQTMPKYTDWILLSKPENK